VGDPDSPVSALIYFDNAATSWPKPPGVADAMAHFLDVVGANPGRSGHRLSLEAGRIVHEAREAVAELFHAPDPLRVVFGANATEALNLAIQGYLRPGDHVITSSMEHNSVMRPLRSLTAGGRGEPVELTVVPCSPEGLLDPSKLTAAVRPETSLIILNHASNVCGALLPVSEAGAIAREKEAQGYGRCLLLVDAAQTAGAYPIDVEADEIDLLAFTGHKAMGGPMGTGGLVIGQRVDLERLLPLMQGGTGSRSEQEVQPDFLPDVYESGTPNAVGLAGLAVAVRWVLARGAESIRQHEVELTSRLVDGLRGIAGVTIYGPRDPALQTATVSFSVDGLEPSEVGLHLDDEYGILCRVGLHCAPAAHRTLGTFPQGTVRFGLGIFNTLEEIDTALGAVREVASGRL
jgi:cysteine desulfurase/selenocysteine lyase